VRYNKKDKQSVVPWFSVLLIVFIMSGIIGFAAIPKSLAAQAIMEVYQQDGRKAFGQGTRLDIFNDPKLGGQKLVHPFTKGSYTFAVYNNSNSDYLPYSLEILSENPDNVPLVFSIRKNGEYVYGGENITNMIPLSGINFPEINLGGKKTDLYTLKWEWKTESDYADTIIGNDGTQIFNLFITATGTMPEINDLPPKTGDNFNILLWFAVLFASLLIVFILLFYKRKKKGKQI